MIGGGFIVITENVKDEMDLSLLLDMYVHFDIQKPSFTNKTLGELLQCIDKNSLQGDSEKRLYDYLSNAVLKNDKLRNAVRAIATATARRNWSHVPSARTTDRFMSATEAPETANGRTMLRR